MQFTTIEFLLFYVLFFGVYWALKSKLVLQNILILIAGCVFYGWWDWRFLGLILFTVVTTWWCGIMTAKSHPRLWTGLNITVNIGILIAFKYFNFFKENIRLLLSTFGINIDWFTIDILLPIGISFYTFQAIGYSIDVYRGNTKPDRNLLSFATFIMFFPQLLAGPIERASQLLPQINRQRKWDYDLAVDGARELLWGLFKKIAIADVCGIYIDNIYSLPQAPVWKLTVAAILFMLQIYCDFSGYCNMARGMAAMLGMKLSVNFRYPFFSRNVAEFWHRWHITLMSWFRDYVYIPLGGSRHGIVRACINIMIVFVLSGLWHGASWNFIIWGALWGLLMVSGRLVRQHSYKATQSSTSFPIDVLKMTVMAYVAILLFVFFRIKDIHLSATIVVNVAGFLMILMAILYGILIVGRLAGAIFYKFIAAVACLAIAVVWVTMGSAQAIEYIMIGIFPLSIVAMIAFEWRGRAGDHALVQLRHITPSLRKAVYWSIIIIIILSNDTNQSFIYYQF